MRLDTRKEQLLSAVVREHARTAQPVASEHLKGEIGVSSATVRNEMAALEREGFLRQPHTSAGRVPTEAGYRYYVEHCVAEKGALQEDAASDFLSNTGGTQDAALLNRGEGQDPALQDVEHFMKHLARKLAEHLSEGVFIGFSPQSTYYTGLSYLFSQSEFSDVDLVRHVGAIIDNLDKIVARLFDEVEPGVRVYVGSENPFGEQCGTVVLRTSYLRDATTILGVLGPMRMDYDRTIAVMHGIHKTLWKN